MTKILITSDWHADAITMGISRFAEIERAVEKMIDHIEEHDIDAFMFLGDLANPDKGARTLRACRLACGVAERLDRARIPNLWLCGNHDVVDSSDMISTVSVIPNSKHTTVVGEPGVYFILDIPVVCLPYVSKSVRERYEDMESLVSRLFDSIPEHDRRNSIVAGHLTSVTGAFYSSEMRDFRRGVEYSLPIKTVEYYDPALVVNGHYHMAQSVGSVKIPGSPIRFDFGEQDNEPAFMVAEGW